MLIGIGLPTASSLSQLSGGRFTLGVGVGARPDDSTVVGRDFHRRGRDWDRALERLVVGGASEQSIARTVRWADGWTASGGIGDNLAPFQRRIREAWHGVDEIVAFPAISDPAQVDRFADAVVR